MDRPLDHLGGLVRTVSSAASVDEALRRIASGLTEIRLEPRVVALAVLDVSDGRRIASFLASWTPVETFFSPGVAIDASLTPGTGIAFDQLIAGNLLALEADSADFGLVSDLFKAEGLQLILALPLRVGTEVHGFLGIGSAIARPLEELEMVLLDAFGRGVGESLLRLASDLRSQPGGDQSG